MNKEFYKNGINPKTPTIVITHTDLDGVGVSIIAKYYLSNIIDTYYCDYNNVDDIIKKLFTHINNNPSDFENTQLIIGDISPREQESIDLIDNFSKNHLVLMIDHHSTSEWMNKYDWCSSKSELPSMDDPNTLYKRCGTWQLQKVLFRLIIEYYKLNKGQVVEDKFKINPNEISRLEKFTHLVNEYDCWYWEKSYTKDAMRLNTLYYIMFMLNSDCTHPTINHSGYNFKVTKTLQHEDIVQIQTPRDSFINYILDEIKYPSNELVLYRNNLNALVDEKLRSDNQIILNIDKTKREGIYTTPEKNITYKFVYVYLDNKELTSKVGHYINKDLTYDFAVVINKNFNTISFRGNKPNVDLSVIAKEIDIKGGGHPEAAGCNVETFLSNTNIVLL